MALYGVVLVFFLLLYPMETALLSALGVEAHLGALLGAPGSLAPGLALARPICQRLCPEMIAKGDAQAERRLAALAKGNSKGALRGPPP